MATAVAQRMREYRARRKQGRMVVPIQMDENLLEVLLTTRELAPAKLEDRAAISAATESLLKKFLEN
jgi:hypothetical protein